MRKWCDAATPEQKANLAALVGTSEKYLFFLASDNPAYLRRASPEMARKLERAMVRMATSKRNDNLPVIFREQLSSVCSVCEYARECRKSRA